MFPKWYEKLSDNAEMDMESEEYALKKQARKNILKRKTQKVECDEKIYITEQQYADILCGIRKLEDTVSENLQRQVDTYTCFKTREKLIREFMENDELVTDWEKRMYQVLDEIDAKMVSVVLVAENGATAEGKMQVERLKYRLLANQTADTWDFDTYVGGQRIMEKLGKKRYEDLPLAEITKISFRGKAIYTKEAEV